MAERPGSINRIGNDNSIRMAIQLYPDNLESERLLTRKLTVDDSKIWSEFFSDKEAVAYFPASLSSNEERAK